MIKISLQGSMAVGKTSIAKLIEAKIGDQYKVLYEYTKVRPKGLDPRKELDYYSIQKHFINIEIERYNDHLPDNVIFDLGPEEIEFYSLNFPKSHGFPWNVEKNLIKELNNLRDCKIDKVIYLYADLNVLKHRKDNDTTRNRDFFDTYIDKLHPLKMKWMKDSYDTEIINVSELSPENAKAEVLKVIRRL